MQKQDRRRVFRAGLPVKDVDSVDLHCPECNPRVILARFGSANLVRGAEPARVKANKMPRAVRLNMVVLLRVKVHRRSVMFGDMSSVQSTMVRPSVVVFWWIR